MDIMQPGDMIIIHIVGGKPYGETRSIKIEHRRQDQTLKPPSFEDVRRFLGRSATHWNRRTACLPTSLDLLK